MQQKLNWFEWEDAVASELPDVQVKVSRNDIHTSYSTRTIPDLFTEAQKPGLPISPRWSSAKAGVTH